MIQPAVPSILAPPAARPSPPSTGSGAGFALPAAVGDVPAVRAEAPAGSDRHDHAVPGNGLPIAAGVEVAVRAPETAAPPVATDATTMPVAGDPRAATARTPTIPFPLPRKPAAPTPERPIARRSTPVRDEEQTEAEGSDATKAAMLPVDATSLPVTPTPVTPTPVTPTPVPSAPILNVPVPNTPVRNTPVPSANVPAPNAPARNTPVPSAIVPPSPVVTADPPPVPTHDGPVGPRKNGMAADPIPPMVDRGPPLAPAAVSTASVAPSLLPAALPTAAVPHAATIEPLPTAAIRPTTPAVPSDALAPLPDSGTVAPVIPPPSRAVAPDRPPSPTALLPLGWRRAAIVPHASAPAVNAPTANTPPGTIAASDPVPIPRPVADPVRAVAPAIITVASSTIATTLPEVRAPATTTVQHREGDGRDPGLLRPREAGGAAPPAPPPPVASAQPAGIVFGAARFAAQVAEERDEPARPFGVAPLAATPTIERAVAGAPAVTPAPIDLTREQWPHAMIERIEMIRDAADAADTRIRLVPDALGGIDVEVRRDGDTLNVRFHAEQAQTRTLLAEAAPRLAEAAEARGLRLGQASVGGGGTDAGTAGQGQQRPPLPAAPPRARRSPVADAERADDPRLA